jgi:hypothetical protein
MGIGQRHLLGLVPLGGVGWIAPRVDHSDKQRAGDGRHLVGADAGKIGIVDGDGLAQISQGIKRGELRLGRVAGNGVAVVLGYGHAAAKPAWLKRIR